MGNHRGAVSRLGYARLVPAARFGLRAPTLYKKPHNDNPHGRISRLDATKHRIVADVFYHARRAGLFTAAPAREKSEAQAANRARFRGPGDFEI